MLLGFQVLLLLQAVPVTHDLLPLAHPHGIGIRKACNEYPPLVLLSLSFLPSWGGLVLLHPPAHLVVPPLAAMLASSPHSTPSLSQGPSDMGTMVLGLDERCFIYLNPIPHHRLSCHLLWSALPYSRSLVHPKEEHYLLFRTCYIFDFIHGSQTITPLLRLINIFSQAQWRLRFQSLLRAECFILVRNLVFSNTSASKCTIANMFPPQVQGVTPRKPSTDSAEGGKSNGNTGSKRITTPHACAECKRRKIRCDGQQPCGQCLSSRAPKRCFYDKHRQRVIPSRK